MRRWVELGSRDYLTTELDGVYSRRTSSQFVLFLHQIKGVRDRRCSAVSTLLALS